MRNVLVVKRADRVDVGDAILLPQHGTGPVLVADVEDVQVIDGGKRVELTTGGRRKHVVGAADRLAVVL